MGLTIPERLVAICRQTPERLAWLARLPVVVRGLEQGWSLELGAPFDDEEVSCGWVAPATLGDGTRAVLKIGMPHMEAEHEIDGLRFWKGGPTVRVLDFNDDSGAMLLERCEPGTHLRAVPEDEQDVIVAGLLRRLWRVPVEPHPFRPLSVLIQSWTRETLAQADCWADPGLVREGVNLLADLSQRESGNVLLGTDVHAGNVLRAHREPWLLIDPKPFVGDPAYDATQHLLNCATRLRSDPRGTIRRFADLLELDPDRIRLWTFARAAADPREDWTDHSLMEVARQLAP